MKHSTFLKFGLYIGILFTLSCCVNEEDSFWSETESADIRSFFNVEPLQSRSGDFTADLAMLVINTLKEQDNLLMPIQKYKERYGIPMWQYSVGISTVDGYQLFVPIYKTENPDEIQSVWFFGIFDGMLYQFTRIRPQSNDILEEYWRFDYFTIHALGKRPKSRLSFESVAKSRAESLSDCQLAYVELEYTDYDGNTYYTKEPKGMICWDESKEAYVEIDIVDVPDNEDEFGTEIPIGHGGGTGNNNGELSGNVAPKAKAMFRNSNMTDTNWAVIENMLEKIIEDCMGENLYNGLLEKLNGSTLSIQFVNSEGSSFYFDGSTSSIKLSNKNVESNHLIHEMFHAYQAYQETADSYQNATINLEIEAHYAQYLYLKKLPEYSGSKWEKTYHYDSRHKAISMLEWYIDSRSGLDAGVTESAFNNYYNHVVDEFKASKDYKNCLYDSSRQRHINFSVLKNLTINCQL